MSVRISVLDWVACAQTHSMIAVIQSPAGSTVSAEPSPPAAFQADTAASSSVSEYGPSDASVCRCQL